MKKVLIILLLATLTLGAGAQVPDGCELPPLPELSAKERKELKTTLDSYIDTWKTIGPSGKNPTLTFKDLNGERLVFEANYEMDDSTAIQFTSNYQWLRLSTLYEATHRLSDIFDMAAKLGLSVVVHAYVKLPNGNQAAFGTYDNATLRRVLAMDNFTAAYIYADILTIRPKIPMLTYDSMYITAVDYCNHLYTVHMHSTAADDPTVSSQFFWMINNNWYIINNDFMEVLAMDDTKLRIVGSQEGNNDTVTLEYTPEQLIGEEPAIDVDLAGQYIAMSTSRGCPVALPDSVGTWTHCSYDAQLKVVVFHYTVTELAILGVEGKENQLKNNLLNTFVATEGEDFLILLVSTNLGVELRWQSRTTPRNVTVSYTPDELRAFILERQ